MKLTFRSFPIRKYTTLVYPVRAENSTLNFSILYYWSKKFPLPTHADFCLSRNRTIKYWLAALTFVLYITNIFLIAFGKHVFHIINVIPMSIDRFFSYNLCILWLMTLCITWPLRLMSINFLRRRRKRYICEYQQLWAYFHELLSKI